MSSRDSTPSAAVETIASIFTERFSTWGIVLPSRALREQEPGRIRKAGWHINYIFGLEGNEPYVEYYASHRMTSDSRERIYGSGRTESLPAIQQFMFYDPNKSGDEEKARREYEEHNRRVVEELRSLGLFPEDDINAHLRTNPELSGRKRKEP